MSLTHRPESARQIWTIIDVGDRVIATVGLGGGFLWPHVPANTTGIVIRDHGHGQLRVVFDNQRTRDVRRDQIALSS